jgi:hypothetical protein
LQDFLNAERAGADLVPDLRRIGRDLAQTQQQDQRVEARALDGWRRPSVHRPLVLTDNVTKPAAERAFDGS